VIPFRRRSLLAALASASVLAALVAPVVGADATPVGSVARVVPQAVASVPVPRAVATVPLLATWKVTAYSQLRISDGTMTCSWRSLVRTAPRPASAVTLLCLGAEGSHGLAFRLVVSVPAKGASKAVSVRFPRLSYATTSALLAAAPLEVPLAGSTITRGAVSFRVPTGWRAKAFTTAMGLTPVTNPTCEVWVFDAIRPDLSTGETSLDHQLYGVVASLYPAGTTLKGELGVASPYYSRRVGNRGDSVPFVGLTLDVNFVPVNATMLVLAGNLAVPVVEIGASCAYGGVHEVAPELVIASITAPGISTNVTGYSAQLPGIWSSSDATVGTANLFGANGHYASGSSISGVISLGGSLHSATVSFVGAGVFAATGPYLARFPSAAGKVPSSVWHSVYLKRTGAVNRWAQCEIGLHYVHSITVREPSEICKYKVA
jgi:hypothetical protein